MVLFTIELNPLLLNPLSVWLSISASHIVIYRSFNLGLFSRDVCKLSSLDDDARGPLMNAARRLAGAFTDLLTVAKPGSSEVMMPHSLTYLT